MLLFSTVHCENVPGMPLPVPSKTATVITDLFCLLGLQFLRCQSSDMDAPIRSLGGRNVPDGAVGIYQQL